MNKIEYNYKELIEQNISFLKRTAIFLFLSMSTHLIFSPLFEITFFQGCGSGWVLPRYESISNFKEQTGSDLQEEKPVPIVNY